MSGRTQSVFGLPKAVRSLLNWRSSESRNGSPTPTVSDQVSNPDESSPTANAKTPEQNAESILQRLEWTVIKRLDGLLQGDYRSLFRGFGLDLADLREYQASDDVRFIDWNVTARMDTPYVREFQEDREVTAWFLLDMSGSVEFGSHHQTKRAVATQITGVLARVLTRHGNQVGALLYNQASPADASPGQNSKYRVIPPKHGRRQVLHLLDQIHATPQARTGALPAQNMTDLAFMIEAARQAVRRRSVILVISDFISSPGWERPLALLARRHEVVALKIYDPLEISLPDIGQLTLTDPETGEQLLVDSSDKRFRARFESLAHEREQRISKAMMDAGVDCVPVGTQDDLARALMGLTELRKRRRKDNQYARH